MFDDADWIDVDDESDPHIPDASEANIEMVSRMMASIRKLSTQLAEYEVLHVAEQRRLDEQHAKVAGPIVRRIRHLQTVVESYGVRSFLDFKKTKIATPNGTITSRVTKPKLVVDDHEAGNFWQEEDPSLVDWKPKVLVAPLRAKLDQMEVNGEIYRCVVTDEGEMIGEQLIKPGEEYRQEFELNQTGRYRIVGFKAPEDDPNMEPYIPGVFWEPSGTLGSGRNFHVVIA